MVSTTWFHILHVKKILFGKIFCLKDHTFLRRPCPYSLFMVNLQYKKPAIRDVAKLRRFENLQSRQ